MKLQSFAEWLFSLLQAATAGCFAEAQVLQRMADFRSRTACSAIFSGRFTMREREALLQLWTLEKMHLTPLPIFNHIQKVGKERSWEGGLSWGRGVD